MMHITASAPAVRRTRSHCTEIAVAARGASPGERRRGAGPEVEGSRVLRIGESCVLGRDHNVDVVVDHRIKGRSSVGNSASDSEVAGVICTSNHRNRGGAHDTDQYADYHSRQEHEAVQPLHVRTPSWGGAQPALNGGLGLVDWPPR